MSKQKKGFTLIELMVVIVIIGILAAVAIPKLFGMSAKAKASEVGPAAGTWSKLQLAYITERESTGSFKEIAYNPPGNKPATGNAVSETDNFSYSEISSSNGWQADAKANDIKKACEDETLTWSIEYEIESTTEGTGGTSTSSGSNDAPSTVSNGCKPLTPNFCKLGVDSDIIKTCDGGAT